MTIDGSESDQRGMTVIEVLVALVVLSLGIVGVAISSSVASRSVAWAGRHEHAAVVAQAKLDSLTARGADELQDGTFSEEVWGFPVEWEIGGTDPKRITLVVLRQIGAKVLADTFQTSVAKR
jgi:prepilin-type N-terminal cleavage/methylation domain-containing protein